MLAPTSLRLVHHHSKYVVADRQRSPFAACSVRPLDPRARRIVVEMPRPLSRYPSRPDVGTLHKNARGSHTTTVAGKEVNPAAPTVRRATITLLLVSVNSRGADGLCLM
jgi:hypothetical protein